jgi:hypothetical protein
MNEAANKQLMQRIFAELSNGNDKPFLDAMADDMKWQWMGSGQWSRTFDGKAAVLEELWAAVRATLVAPYKVIASRFIADGDFVAIEALGQNTTPEGKIYNNRYCWVCTLREGKIRELNEYMDTDLVTRTFQE